MAKARMIQTSIWDDEWFSELNINEKLLFLYFLTDALTDICGGYEISLKRIVFDTGIERDEVLKVLEKFEKAEKVFYREGWIFIENFIKHQNWKSDTIDKGIKRSLKNCPDWIRDRVSIRYQTLSIGYQYPIEEYEYGFNNSNSNSNYNLNSHSTPPRVENSNGNENKDENPVCVKNGSKFSEEERRKFIQSQHWSKNPEGWLIKSESGCFDKQIEKWFKNPRPDVGVNGAYKVVDECNFCKKHDDYPDDVKPCSYHQKGQFEDWKKRRDEFTAANDSSPLFAASST